MILSDKLHQELREIQKQLDAEGKLLSRSQLDQYYQTFRERFGPRILKGLDGEPLLETIHNNGNRDSLVYWLEFKNDDELPTTSFGSIAGGSALKFGIYKRKETGAWMIGSPTAQKELSVAEAVEVARKHRDQLVQGVELLESLPSKGTDGDYQELQEDMNQLAPDVSNSAWGHKYFSMLHPDKLDDYHNPDYQRFHLIKLLQVPPSRDGRYICGGRYVAIANEINLSLLNLTKILNVRNGRPRRYWRIGTKLGGVDSRWDLMQDTNCVAVGWSKLADLSDITYNKESKEKIRTAIATHYPQDARIIGRKTQQLFNYVAAIKDGDIVLASDGEKVLGIGRVVGGYYFEAGSDAPHRLLVEWLSLAEWKMIQREGLRTTVSEIKKPENLVEVETKLLEPAPPPPIKDVRPKAPPRLTGIPGRIQAILERKGQVILYGPPGTGKTYWAEVAACDLASYVRFGKSFGQLSDDEHIAIVGSEKESEGMVRLCCFHPAYGYEDFLEGYRPTKVNDQLVFEMRDGVFKRLCADARADQSHNYYLIIDEINRGDIPRIFGELLTVMEKDKRGKSIILPLSGEPFQVPDNVYIVGTMNTADRSIALLDTALRRRFGFVELMPDLTVLGNTAVEGIPLGPWLAALNENICKYVGRDARNLQIGHAYLLDGGRPVTTFPKFARIVQDDILPLLEEYCYEDYTALARILGKSLVDENGQHIRHELFDLARQDDLIQALKAIDPDIDTSAQAILSEPESLEDEEGDEESDDEDIEQEG
jgi:5-methylcytosine-specific restriction protein B